MSERTTLIVSALAALAILGLGVTAQQTGGRLENRVEALESDLRFQLEMTWRHDGKTREARLATLEETLAAWQKSPQTDADRLLLENWLQRSIVNSLPGESGVFPPTPAFASVHDKPSDAAAPPKKVATPAPKASAPRDHELRPGQAYTPPRAKEIFLTPRTPAGAGSQAVVPPQRVIAAKPATPVEQPPVAEATPPAAANEVVEVAEAVEAPPQVAKVERKEAPTAAEVGEVYREEILPQGTAGTGRPGSLEGEIVVESAPVKESPRREPVMVNLAELNAQIRGYHDGLHEVEATIVRERGKLTLGHIAKLVGELEQLAGQHQFVQLYYDGLSDRERRLVTEPRSMANTIDLVDRQRAAIVEAEGDFLTTLESDVEEDELQRRLKAIAAAEGMPAEKDEAAKADRQR